MSVPLTHPISLFVHEQIIPILKEVATESYDGNVSEFLRMTIYTELYTRGKLPLGLIKGLG